MFVSRPSLICLQPAKEARNRESVGVWRLALGGPKGQGSLAQASLAWVALFLRASPRKGAGECRGNPYRPHPNSDDYLLRPFRADRVYCKPTQAEAWAEIPRPFGPRPASNPTGSQASAWVAFYNATGLKDRRKRKLRNRFGFVTSTRVHLPLFHCILMFQIRRSPNEPEHSKQNSPCHQRDHFGASAIGSNH
jgi:hypothetical protein